MIYGNWLQGRIGHLRDKLAAARMQQWGHNLDDKRVTIVISSAARDEDVKALTMLLEGEPDISLVPKLKRVEALIDFWRKVTPPSDWPVMKRFIADLQKALEGP